MIRKRYLIKKVDLSQWIENPEISKVEISVNENRALTNKDLFAIHAYHRITVGELHGIFGCCAKVVQEDNEKRFLNPYDRSVLTGIAVNKSLNFITDSILRKLIDIAKRNKLNLGLSKNVVKLAYVYVSPRIQETIDRVIEDIRQATFHMNDEQAKPVIDSFLTNHPELLGIHNKEWYYKYC